MARIRPNSTVARATASAIAHTATDAHGRFRFDQLTPGARFAVLASSVDHVPSSLAPGAAGLTPLITANAGDTARYDIVLQSVR